MSFEVACMEIRAGIGKYIASSQHLPTIAFNLHAPCIALRKYISVVIDVNIIANATDFET